jgi:multimeric flavodoxin WrbA
MKPFTVLVLNGSLKPIPQLSNTEELAQLVLTELEKHLKMNATVIRLADKTIPAGVGFKESADDEWPSIAKQIVDADIVLFATPIWWGERSSLLQRVIERMDSFDEGALGGREALLNKVAGVVVTGSEDGAQHVIASILEVLQFLYFTIPPACAAYWVGEAGGDTKDDRMKRRESEATKKMAALMAKHLAHYANILRENPISA